MKKVQLVILAAACVSLVCSGMRNVLPTSGSQEIVQNGIELEKKFGDDESLGEFRLVGSGSSGFVAVADNGDVIVPDEQRLKIFDSDGNPKRTVGGPGDDPGKFDRDIHDIRMADNGYFVVVCDGRYETFSVYAPDYSFVKQVDIIEFPIMQYLYATHGQHGPFSIGNMYAYGPDEFIFCTHWLSAPFESTTAYIHVNEGIGRIYREFKRENLYSNEYAVNPAFKILPNRRFIYFDTNNDRVKRGDEWYYVLNVYHLDTGETKFIEHPYTPVKIPESMLHVPELGREGMREMFIENQKRRIEKYKEMMYFDPIRDFWVDGHIVFVLTNKTDEEKGRFVDVIDADTGKHIRSAYFKDAHPFVVKNGVGYNFVDGGSKMVTQLWKYRINPEVYREFQR